MTNRNVELFTSAIAGLLVIIQPNVIDHFQTAYHSKNYLVCYQYLALFCNSSSSIRCLTL